jgi:hypothetical protein
MFFPLTSTQVSQIKEKVEEKEGIPPVQQRLIFGGKQMYVIPRSQYTTYSPATETARPVQESA